MSKPAPTCTGRPGRTCDKAPQKAGKCWACYKSAWRDKKRKGPKRPPAEDLGDNPVRMDFEMTGELAERFYERHPAGERCSVLRRLLDKHLGPAKAEP